MLTNLDTKIKLAFKIQKKIYLIKNLAGMHTHHMLSTLLLLLCTFVFFFFIICNIIYLYNSTNWQQKQDNSQCKIKKNCI